jgi:GNAT superfamily N-acetyltransferase
MQAAVNPSTLQVRSGTVADLDAINAVIERAIMTWSLPDRVKRLSLPVYRYDISDLDTLKVVVAEEAGSRIIGVAAWEEANPREVPEGCDGLLLHGIYVDPDRHQGGVGTRLLRAAQDWAQARGLDGVLVKAQSGAERFFLARGFQRLAVEEPDRDYPHRLWKVVPRRD